MAIYTTDCMAQTKPAFCFFSHGIADTGKQAEKYALNLIPFPITTFDYDDARHYLKKIPKINLVSLAQTNEILCFKRAFDIFEQKLIAKYGSNYQIIIYGVSRGASVVIMFLALYPEKLSSVSVVILESPFDSVTTILEHLCTLYPAISFNQALTILEQLFPKYDRFYPSPLSLVPAIKKDIPLLLVCSKNDTLVPVYSSIKLYEEFLQQDYKKIFLFLVEKSDHAKIINGPESKKYIDFVHNFFSSHLR